MPRNNAKKIRKQDLSKSVARQWEAIARGDPSMLEDFALPQTRPPRAKPEQREKKEVQRPLVKHLRKHLPLGSVVHAQAIQPLNENHKFAMQNDGVLFGMPDLLIIIPGPRFFLIECKSETGRLNRNQQYVQPLLTALGVAMLSECRSVEQAVEWLKAEGVAI